MQATQSKYINTIDFLGLYSWDVKAYLSQSNTFNPSFPLVLFGEFLSKPNIEKIRINDEDEYKILGVRSYGKGVFANRIVKGKTLKMREYQKAKNNHLFWCKVDTKNGAFGVIKEDLADGIASSNMTFAEIDVSKINADFLQLLFTSKGVMQYLDSFVTGTTNRKYIRPDQLLNEIKIPLPKLSEQEIIVSNYFKKVSTAEKLLHQASELEAEIERYIYKELGLINKIKTQKAKGLHCVDFVNLSRWDTNFLYQKDNENISKYPLVSYDSLFESLNNGIPARNYTESGIRFLKVADIKNNRVDNSNLKYIKKFRDSDFVEKDTLLITRKGTVGNSYYVTEHNIFTASSEIFIIKLNKKVSGNYLAEINLIEFIQNQYREKNTGTIMPSLSQEKLKEILVPLPPLDKQREIELKIKFMKSELNNYLEMAKMANDNAIREFEKAIFNN